MPMSGSQKAGVVGEFLSRGLQGFMQTRGLILQERRQREQDTMKNRMQESNLKTDAITQQLRNEQLRQEKELFEGKKRYQNLQNDILELNKKLEQDPDNIEMRHEKLQLKMKLLRSEEDNYEMKRKLSFVVDHLNRVLYGEQITNMDNSPPQPPVPQNQLGPRKEQPPVDMGQAYTSILSGIKQAQQPQQTPAAPQTPAPQGQLNYEQPQMTEEDYLEMFSLEPGTGGFSMPALPIGGLTPGNVMSYLGKSMTSGKGEKSLVDQSVNKTKQMNILRKEADEYAKAWGYVPESFPDYPNFPEQLMKITQTERARIALETGDRNRALTWDHEKSMKELASGQSIQTYAKNKNPFYAQLSQIKYSPDVINDALTEHYDVGGPIFDESGGQLTLDQITDYIYRNGLDSPGNPVNSGNIKEHALTKVLLTQVEMGKTKEKNTGFGSRGQKIAELIKNKVGGSFNQAFTLDPKTAMADAMRFKDRRYSADELTNSVQKLGFQKMTVTKEMTIGELANILITTGLIDKKDRARYIVFIGHELGEK